MRSQSKDSKLKRKKTISSQESLNKESPKKSKLN
jgi:hypothetical protein